MSDTKRQEESPINEGISTQKSGKKSASGAGRTRVFAAVVYPDSAPDDWQERLTQEHVSAFVSPLHDQDVNPDGTAKKAHWHVMLMFDGVKSQEQVDALLDRVLGSNRVKHYETVNSTRGYARYLCHMDNPEKHQYSKDDVVSLCGADYEEVIALPSDDWEVLDQIFDYIDETGERYYSELVRYCRMQRRDWWKLLAKRYSFLVISYLKDERQRVRDAKCNDIAEAMEQLMDAGYTVLDPSTGEVIGGKQ